MNTFIALKFLSQLLTPPGLLVVGLLAAALLAWMRARRLGKLLVVLAIGQAILFSLTPVSDALLLPLENEARAAAAAAAPACCYDAIVVLGAGVVTAAPSLRPDPQLTDSSDRLWHAARLYHRGLAPRVVVSGGSYMAQRGGPTQTEAEAMRELLIALGVPADRIILEGRSLNTIDNVREIRALLGAERIALVTSGYHMSRAMRLARQARLNAEAFPADWRIVWPRSEWETYLPSVDAMATATIAFREYLALAFDRRGDSLKP